MAVLPISSDAETKDALRQTDLNFRELSIRMELLEKRVKALEANS